MPNVQLSRLVALTIALCWLGPTLDRTSGSSPSVSFGATPGWAQAPYTVISTGREGGNYYSIGMRLRTAMMVEAEFSIRVEPSSGSVQNLARMADPESDVALALTQSDALGRFVQSNPEFGNEFIVLGDAGKECAVLISARRGGAKSFPELRSMSGGQISVDDRGSGASATFDYLKAMDPELAETEAVYVDTMQALLQMKVSGAHSPMKAAMLVQSPTKPSEAVEIVLDNPSDYQLVPILESHVKNTRLPDDSVVYSFEKVRIGGAGTRTPLEVDTICTRSLLLASKDKLSREDRSKLSLVMLKSSKSIFGANP